VLFLSVTAEEKGLLGSKYYVQHPLYPLERTLADFNMDGLNPWGRTTDLQIIGQGNSTLEDLLATAAAGQRRIVQPESQPEKGFFYRSDHFEFAKAGVPCLYFRSGTNCVGRPPGFGQKKIDEYIQNDYHKVTDTVKPGWDFSGAVEDLRLLFQVGWTVAGQEEWPDWKPDSEFHAHRPPNQQKQ
jgi:Zn-dependent M28 family amino/carboxypeptidase